MTADTLVLDFTELLYLVIFVATIVQLIRRPRRVNLDITLFFGAIFLIIVVVGVPSLFNYPPTVFLASLASCLLMALPYLLLRLVHDFARVPAWVVHTSEVGLTLAVLGIIFLQPLPLPLAIPYVLYFVLIEVYAAVVFVRQASRSHGVTCRRMQSAAIGSFFLGFIILVTGFQMAIPQLAPLWAFLVRIGGLLGAVGYLVGFAPPGWLRRAWQMPALRAFLHTGTHLPYLADAQTIIQELERGAAQSLGAAGATISLWDASAQRLQRSIDDSRLEQRVALDSDDIGLASGHLVAETVYETQKPTFIEDVLTVDPSLLSGHRNSHLATSALGAPMTAGKKRLGVLLVYGPRPALFADDDLALLQLLADQAATILETQALIAEASRAQAREETARLKADFFSAAAHDLRTPLTALLGQTQLLRRRAMIKPDDPIDLRGLHRIEDETRRLIRFVNELLDVSRSEDGRLLGEKKEVDLVALATDLVSRPRLEPHRISIDAGGPLVGCFDRERIVQVYENLLDNAIKYSPSGDDIAVKLWQQDGCAHFRICDHGIGIPADEIPWIFERFHRGRNVNDRQFAGVGLGLFICRAIVEGHGGRIDAQSTREEGTSIHVVLPLRCDPRSSD